MVALSSDSVHINLSGIASCSLQLKDPWRDFSIWSRRVGVKLLDSLYDVFFREF